MHEKEEEEENTREDLLDSTIGLISSSVILKWNGEWMNTLLYGEITFASFGLSHHNQDH